MAVLFFTKAAECSADGLKCLTPSSSLPAAPAADRGAAGGAEAAAAGASEPATTEAMMCSDEWRASGELGML